jgi:hypothetical protein
MRRGGLSSFRPVEANVLAGNALLWLAWDGTHIQAAAVTDCTQRNGARRA